jgi:hypothetical protein
MEDYNLKRQYSALGCETPAAFAAEQYMQWLALLRLSGSPAQANAFETSGRGAGAWFFETAMICSSSNLLRFMSSVSSASGSSADGQQ